MMLFVEATVLMLRIKELHKTEIYDLLKTILKYFNFKVALIAQPTSFNSIIYSKLLFSVKYEDYVSKKDKAYSLWRLSK